MGIFPHPHYAQPDAQRTTQFTQPTISMKNIFIVAGEASSDLHASNLVKSLKEINHHIKFFGLGGEKMQKAGVELIYNLVDLAVVGFFEVLKNLGRFKEIFEQTLRRLDQEKPDLVILVDYPGFNLRLAKEVKKRDIPVVYFISPQVWAWGEKRIELIKKLVNKMIVLFKFEEDLYKKYGIDVEFVGHPLLDIVKPILPAQEFKNSLRISESDKVIALLPGSRVSEVTKHLPLILCAAKIIFKKLPDKKIQFLVAQAAGLKNELFQIVKKEVSIPITVVKDKTYDCLNISDLALVCSGTATLETAIMEKPMVIIYKVSPVTALLLKPMLKIPDIGLVNVVAGKRIVPECVQQKAKPDLIAFEALSILSSPQKITEIKQNLISVKQSLGVPAVLPRAAGIISKYLK